MKRMTRKLFRVFERKDDGSLEVEVNKVSGLVKQVYLYNIVSIDESSLGGRYNEKWRSGIKAII